MSLIKFFYTHVNYCVLEAYPMHRRIMSFIRTISKLKSPSREKDRDEEETKPTHRSQAHTISVLQDSSNRMKNLGH